MDSAGCNGDGVTGLNDDAKGLRADDTPNPIAGADGAEVLGDPEGVTPNWRVFALGCLANTDRDPVPVVA